MDVRIDEKPHQRLAVIRPFAKRRGRIEISQSRVYDPLMFGGLGKWTQPRIEWAGERATTVDEVDQMAAALQEAAQICRRWEGGL